MFTGHRDRESVRPMGSRDQRPHCPLLSHGQHTLPAKNTSNTDRLFSPTMANPPSIGRLDSPIFERAGAGGTVRPHRTTPCNGHYNGVHLEELPAVRSLSIALIECQLMNVTRH